MYTIHFKIRMDFILHTILDFFKHSEESIDFPIMFINKKKFSGKNFSSRGIKIEVLK